MLRAFAALLLVAAPAVARPDDNWRGIDGPKAVAMPPEEHVMPDGTRVPTPEIASLDCEEMRAVLREIDRTGYRGTEPLPVGDPNMPLFDYENRLAAAAFQRCSARVGLPEDPSSAFTDGFEAD